MIIEAPIAMVSLLAAGVATITDISERKVYNWLTLPLLILGPSLHGAIHGGRGVLSSIGAIAAVVGILCAVWLLFGIRLGGGDSKLLMGLAAVVGWPLAGWLCLYSALAGFMLGVAMVLWRGKLNAVDGLLALNRIDPQGGAVRCGPDYTQCPDVPYAVAILMGTVLTVVVGPL